MLLVWYNVAVVFINFMAGIYRTLAKAYNLLVGFTVDIFSPQSNDVLGSQISNISDTIYTLIAVFMLFRITVSLIQYLVDPDKVNDKRAGGGALVTRIIISLLLVLIFPTIMNNVVYPLQTALLKEDSILYKLFEPTNVNAEAKGNQECLNAINNSNQIAGGNSKESKQSGLEENIINCTFNSELYNSVDSFINQKTSGKAITHVCKLDGKDINCNEAINGNYYVKTSQYSVGKGINASRKITYNLTSSPEVAQAAETAVQQGSTIQQINSGLAKSLDEIANSEGGKFSMNVASSFSTMPEKVRETDFLASSKGVEDLGKAMENEELDLDLFLGIICGIILIVFVLILCIEVVIRNLKLILLQILAPVAFISYMNPSDKVLDNWFKQFLSCYLDLFIKILGINIVLFFIDSILGEMTGGLEVVLIYIGLFLFAKMVPNIISDVLGIKNMGGSFKDSMNALKTAAFVGTGAVAGGVAGAVTGMGKGASFGTIAGGMLGGAFSGANAGAKNGIKGVTGSINTQRQKNIDARARNSEGGSWWGQTRSKLSHTAGQKDDYEIAEAQNSVAKEAISSIGNYEDEASKNILKLSGMKRSDNGGVYANDSFGRYAQASADLEAFKAGSYTGTKDANQLQADLKMAQKEAIADYTQMVRTPGLTTTPAGVDYSTIIKPDDMEKDQQRLKQADFLIQSIDSTRKYDKDAKGIAEKLRDTSATTMTQTKANHDAAKKNK